MVIRIYVNHYGWVAGELRDPRGEVCGLKFVRDREAAKCYPPQGLIADEVCYYIEWQLKCNYDRFTDYVPWAR